MLPLQFFFLLYAYSILINYLYTSMLYAKDVQKIFKTFLGQREQCFEIKIIIIIIKSRTHSANCFGFLDVANCQSLKEALFLLKLLSTAFHC